ncbi:NAD(P)/FAD-dependent oxidoreductase [Flectobacillus sp. DC10W]|uniref:NAD(P)/FAD-dependent oxidoreductase n=1 Tax=Flectobacillus longus TaxID=2984207 RepID=A0ABT6YVA7_9BACT|nr:NAD(P)/FAD-dependent oxidoreductase [Flectobacillus longus]MDI9867515.1 NAD(P)/FAD-dependent oxidoreductase [Flectobacillus longus]
MKMVNQYDAIIIGGSYSGLSSAMTLGRSLRKVMVLDNGKPCNRYTPHSHNFITQDGVVPYEISQKAKAQVLAYPTVSFREAKVLAVLKTEEGFEVKTSDDSFFAKKIILATGIKDIFPDIKAFEDCWGKSILHCPYCHGYEVRSQQIAVIGNGDIGYDFAKLIYQWSNNISLLTDGTSTLSKEQADKLTSMGIRIVENKIEEFLHTDGQIESIKLSENLELFVDAVFARVPFKQSTNFAENLGCNFLPSGYVQVDEMQRTSVQGVYAVGDSTSMMRSVSVAVATGTKAGAMLNKELIEEEF